MELTTLRDIETTLAALGEVDLSDLTPELEQEFREDVAEALRAAPHKRDAVAAKLDWFLMQANIADAAISAHNAQIERLKARSERFQANADRLKDYVLDVMRELPKPAKGPRKLEGETATLKACGVPPSVDVIDQAEIPPEYKRCYVAMPYLTWEFLGVENCPGVSTDIVVDKRGLLEALKHGDVPGARLNDSKLRLAIE